MMPQIRTFVWPNVLVCCFSKCARSTSSTGDVVRKSHFKSYLTYSAGKSSTSPVMCFKTHSWRLHISLDITEERNDGLTLQCGLERQHLLLFQKTQGRLPVSTPGRSQLPEIQVQEGLMPPASTDIWIYISHVHILTCRHIYILFKIIKIILTLEMTKI